MGMAIAIILSYAFIVALSIQIIYYLFFSSFAFAKSLKKKPNTLLPVSVIICAKNEAENLEKFLPSVINQDYSNFELVLINDSSSDNSLEIMEAFKAKHQHIKIVNVKNVEAFLGNKKYALTLGIKASTHEHLLFTDADCKPLSKNWISEMTKQFSDKKSIILGYGKYKAQKYSFVNTLVRYETLLTAIQYFSYAKLGSPYMAVGRNLAYTKSEFFKTNGFISHIQVRSGDDDLFIRDASTSTNTAIEFNAESFTTSIPPKTFKEWFRQKRRHVSTASYYKPKHQFFLGLFYASKLLFFLLTFIALFNVELLFLVPFLAIYYVIQYLIVGFSAKKLQETAILPYLPFLEIALVLLQFSIFISNYFYKPNHWK